MHQDEGEGPKSDDTKRTARILELVQLIAIHPHRHRRADLAARFEVHHPTIPTHSAEPPREVPGKSLRSLH